MTTEERIEKMERQLVQVRWFNRCLIACIVLSLGVWSIMKTERAWAQSDTKEIRANKFVLEDLKGKTRAELSLEEVQTSMWLWDRNGKVRVSLTVTENGPNLSLMDENSKPIWSAPERFRVIPIK